LDVEFTFDPEPPNWPDAKASLPLHLGFIDRSHPFYLDLDVWPKIDERMGTNLIARVQYQDIIGRTYHFEERVWPSRGLPPYQYLPRD